MGLGQVLVDGEVVAEDADAADLAGVPSPFVTHSAFVSALWRFQDI